MLFEQTDDSRTERFRTVIVRLSILVSASGGLVVASGERNKKKKIKYGNRSIREFGSRIEEVWKMLLTKRQGRGLPLRRKLLIAKVCCSAIG